MAFPFVGVQMLKSIGFLAFRHFSFCFRFFYEFVPDVFVFQFCFYMFFQICFLFLFVFFVLVGF